MKGIEMSTESGQCVGQKESPVYQQLKLIDERLNELSKTRDVLSGRLGNILSDTQPTEGSDAEKAHCESALEGTLLSIRQRIDTEILCLQNITKRLTI